MARSRPASLESSQLVKRSHSEVDLPTQWEAPTGASQPPVTPGRSPLPLQEILLGDGWVGWCSCSLQKL